MNSGDEQAQKHLDPISGEAGAHPVGTAVGAAVGGAATGAAVGTIAGPVGTAVGAAVGAIAGGLLGKAVAEAFDPTGEDAYWESNYASRPYVVPGSTYERYQPAFRLGWEARVRRTGIPWRDMEGDVRAEWEAQPPSCDLSWSEASSAVREAYERASQEPLAPGEPDSRPA